MPRAVEDNNETEYLITYDVCFVCAGVDLVRLGVRFRLGIILAKRSEAARREKRYWVEATALADFDSPNLELIERRHGNCGPRVEMIEHILDALNE